MSSKLSLTCLIGTIGLIGLSIFSPQLFSEKNTPEYVSYLVYEPLLALPGVDLERYHESIASLESSRDRIAETNYYSAAITEDVSEYIYPIEWLYVLAELEQKRRLVIAEPTSRQIREYHETLLAAMDVYDEYLRTLVDWYKTEPAALQDIDNGFSHYSGYTSFAYALSNLEYYRAQMLEQRTIAVARWECYTALAPCAPTVVASPAAVSAFPDFEYNRDVFEIIHALRSSSAGEHPHGYAVARLSAPSCEPDQGPRYYHLWEKSYPDQAHTAFKLDPLTDVVVRDLDLDIYQRSRYYAAHARLGGSQYEMQSLGNYYICPDIVYDITKVKRLLYLYTASQELELPDHLENADPRLASAVADVQAMREQLAADTILDEYSGFQYVEALSVLLAGFPEEELVSRLGRTTTRMLQEQRLVYQLGTFEIDTLVRAVADTNDAIISYAPYGQWNFIGDILVVRSAPTLLLGGSNPSVIPDRVSWIQDPTDTFYRDTFVSYERDLRDQLSRDELTEALIQNKNVGELLLQQALETR